MKKKEKEDNESVFPGEFFDQTIVKTIRIPKDLFKNVENHAKKQGSNFNDTVITALRSFLGLPTEEAALFIQKLFKWVLKTFKEDNFPENVTHQVFRHIQKDRVILEEYQRLTQKQEDKEIINRKIGKMVKQALGATVVGRSLPLGNGELITTYALLRPGKHENRSDL
ncbi:MAG: hypothetical protein HQM08_26815 [Candidatus Riflebacteria bacterium]|nr:hypothetical protein [Candidatus Riflebacteria bacterium]